MTPASLPAGSPLQPAWQSVVLPGGLRLITLARPRSPTVAVRVYVRAGSRYDVAEAADSSGLAHLTEHLLFKRTRLHGQRELFAALERLGGTLEAGTAKEYTNFDAVTRPQHWPVALDILAEILTAPALLEEDLWAEMLVVVEEMRRAQERESWLLDFFAQALWRIHPLRQPVMGTMAGLRSIQPQTLLAFYRERYVAGNMLVVVCGDIEPEAVARLAAEKFEALPSGPALPPPPPHEPPLVETRTAHMRRDTLQTHLCLGIPTVGMAHADRSALKVIELVLGMGGSARLHQRLREAEQLAYTVNTLTAPYQDAGFLAVQAACAPDNAPRVRQIILEEWDKLRQAAVNQDELSAAQGNYAGALARRFETNLALAGIFGVEGLLGQVETLEAAATRIQAVTAADVLRAAQTYLISDRHVAVSLGPEA
jgi:predicted Zn-dependent peptidase